MRNLDFLFLVEHIARELDVVTCLAEKLRRAYGAQVEVKSYFLDVDSTLLTCRPKVVIFPFFYGSNSSSSQYLAMWPEATFVNMCWEQMLSKIDISMKVPRDDTARARVVHLCWSNRHQEFLLGNGVARDHLIVTGNPAMKLYDQPYCRYFATRNDLARRHRIDPQRKWVLFPEAYQYGFMSDDWMRWNVENQNADLGLMREARNYSCQCLNMLLAWANELHSPDDPIFIIRPRPSTPREVATKCIHNVIGDPVGNIAVIKKESVREWILAADHVISSHSTTLIEAALARKPVHIFSPVPLPESLSAEWHDLVPRLRSREEFLDAVRDVQTMPSSASLAAWARQLMLLGDPIEAIVKALANLHKEAVTGQRSHLPDHRRLWDFRVLANAARAWWSRRELEINDPVDIFSAVDVALRIFRWRRALGSE
jgi:surface carbohydrate biosynthesis protein